MNQLVNKLIVLMLLVMPFAIQAEVVQYEMTQSETIESVAKQFNVSTSSIWDLEYNPNILFIQLPEVEVVAASAVPTSTIGTQMFEEQEKIKLLKQIIVLLTKLIELQNEKNN